MFDRFERRIHYLRISVTDRCNLRCRYCMPEHGVVKLSHESILSYEEIAEVAQIAVDLGVDKVRVTGGEPLVRKGVLTLVAMLAKIGGIRDLAMTTNGQLLSDFAQPLAHAGLQRVNVSLDAVSPDRYAELTRGGNVQRVLDGIRAARAAGLAPVKLNCVVEESSSEQDALSVAEFAREEGLEVRFIRRMNTAQGAFWQVEGGTGGDCKQCNRLRLSSDGMIRPCLFSDVAFSVREHGAQEAIRRAVANKPECGRTSRNTFYQVGG